MAGAGKVGAGACDYARMNVTRQGMPERCASLAVQGVYMGASSRKHPGWCGMLYDRVRYE